MQNQICNQWEWKLRLRIGLWFLLCSEVKNFVKKLGISCLGMQRERKLCQHSPHTKWYVYRKLDCYSIFRPNSKTVHNRTIVTKGVHYDTISRYQWFQNSSIKLQTVHLAQNNSWKVNNCSFEISNSARCPIFMQHFCSQFLMHFLLPF